MMFLASCDAVGPDFVKPRINLASTYAEHGAGDARNVEHVAWWRHLNDARLNAMVARGLNQNLDIRTALERIRAAEARVKGTGFESQFSGTAGGSVTVAGGDGIDTDTVTAGLADAAYVFDLFGGVRRGQEQARATLDAARYDVGTVRLAYLNSIVSNYIEARYYQAALALTRETIYRRARTFELLRRSRNEGQGTELPVAQAEAELAVAEASLPALEIGFHTAVYRIATLLAEPAAPLLADMKKGAAQPSPARAKHPGVPANLLRNRPDILAAERRYAAAVAAVGIAEAALYPSLTLSGTVTVSDASTWAFGPVLSLPILGRGPLVARKREAVSEAKQAELAWRAEVLGAVEDVQIALNTYRRKLREVSAQRKVLSSNQRVLSLSRESLNVGETTVLELLDAERAVAAAQTSLATAIRDATQAWVALQVATGSGWATSRPAVKS